MARRWEVAGGWRPTLQLLSIAARRFLQPCTLLSQLGIDISAAEAGLRGAVKNLSAGEQRRRSAKSHPHAMHKRWAAALLLLALAAAGAQASGWAHKFNELAGRPASRAKEDTQFCVVVRTYWGHGNRAGDGGLRRLLRSLQRQTVQSWQAVLLVLDSRPFEDLHHIVEDFQDDRIWVFAEWIDKQFKPKQGVEWAPGYHGTLYNLTDDGIQVCPPSTQWLIVTNGDNQYTDNFMQMVLDHGGAGADAVDLVAFDFYSRFQRPTAPSCDRFAAAEGAPACKRNRLRWCHTDLGANVINYSRFVRENRRFGTLGDVSGGLPAEHFDGVMMQMLMAANWRVKHMEDVCPFNHAPSPQSCGWSGGVWDDRDIVAWATAGGRCISSDEAAKILREEADTEEVTVMASSDGNVTGFEGVTPTHLAVRCLRKKHYMSDAVLGASVEWYNNLCVDDTDLPAFREWQRWRGQVQGDAAGGGDGAAAAAAGAAEQQGGGEVQPEDFWALQAEFYKKAPAEEGAGAAQQQAAEEALADTAR